VRFDLFIAFNGSSLPLFSPKIRASSSELSIELSSSKVEDDCGVLFLFLLFFVCFFFASLSGSRSNEDDRLVFVFLLFRFFWFSFFFGGGVRAC